MLGAKEGTSGRVLDYRQAINSFVRLETELWPNLLSDDEWSSIDLITTWLKSFRSATAQMSATRTPMLSTTHAIFRGLQEDLCDILRSLPNSTSPCLIKGLTDAHRKLSDYYYTFDQSPFYIWSSCKSSIITSALLRPCHIVLDPRISYAALKEEFKDDTNLTVDLEEAKADLQLYFKEKYLPVQPTPLSYTTSTSSISSEPSEVISSSANSHINSRSPQKSFTSRFQRKHTPSDELLEFWNLPQEDFETCDPLKWWLARRSQFPNLYRLSRDLFSIPGKLDLDFLSHSNDN